VPAPAYTRLNVDERRRQLLDAGAALFAEHAYEEISMRDIARAAGVSKPLLYHYFPSKIDLFKAAVAEKATELQRVIEPADQGTPIDQLTSTLDAYLGWIEANSRAWAKLVQSAAALPEARDLVEGFRQQTMDMALARLTHSETVRPALRTVLRGWLGYMDAAILDWTEHGDLPREDLRDLLIAAFVGALLSAQEADPRIELDLSG
jgi:AcrR family transcriptional regulator